MIWEVLSVYDAKAKAFAKPFFNQNLALGVRLFADIANDPDQMVCRNAEDFTLFHLGSWDDNKGTYEQHAKPVNLGLAQAYKR